MEEASEPWFNFSSGSGFYHSDRIWIEPHDVPFGFIRDYAARLRRGEDLARPLGRLHAERERIVGEYAGPLSSDADWAAFDEKLGLARVVFPYVENHNFYVEHWAHSTIWRKMRELGRLLADAEFIVSPGHPMLGIGSPGHPRGDKVAAHIARAVRPAGAASSVR